MTTKIHPPLLAVIAQISGTAGELQVNWTNVDHLTAASITDSDATASPVHSTIRIIGAVV